MKAPDTVMKVWVIIPAYNEAKGIGTLLEELSSRNLSTFVVDDGSSDDTFGIAYEKASYVLRNERNLGKGISIRRAVMFLLQREDFDYVLTMDADNQHAPADIAQFLDEAKKGEVFIIGNRMADPRGMPLIRIWTNKIMSKMISKIVGQSIPDTQCGFRLVHKDVLEKIDIKTDKFEIESEFLIKAARYGISIKSTPIHSIYFKHNTSKIHPFLDTVRFIRFMMRLTKR